MKRLFPIAVAILYAQATLVWCGEIPLASPKDSGTQFFLVLQKETQEHLGLTNSLVQARYSQLSATLTDEEIKMVQSLTGDLRITGGIRWKVSLLGVTNQTMKRLVLAALANYDVFDETIFVHKGDNGGENLYKFNSGDLSPFKQERGQQPTVGIIGIPGPTNKFVVQLSEDDCKKVGRSSISNLIRGTYEQDIRGLTEEEIRRAREVLHDGEIASGYCSSVKLTGLYSTAERRTVLKVLSEYAVGQDPKIFLREEIVLRDKQTNDKYRLKSADLSKLKPETVEKFPRAQ